MDTGAFSGQRARRGKQAVFLDRDGVVNRLMLERGARETPRTAADVELLPGALEGLQQLKAAGFLLLVVTNQPNIAKGKSTWEDDAAITERIFALLGPEASLDGVYACQHHPDAAQVVVPELLQVCDCRKPAPGLIQRGLIDFQLDPAACWMVGDAVTDIQAGLRAGLSNQHLIFVGTECHNATTCVPDLRGAAKYILTHLIA